MARTINLILCVCFICLADRSFAQVQEFYPFRKYSQNEGLSSYNITKILKDEYGFIWVATQDGLNCFDGTSFLVFNKEGQPKYRLNGNTIMDMTEDRLEHCIWLVTSYGGVEKISTITRSRTALNGLDAASLQFVRQWAHAICVCRNILWIGTYSGLYAYDLSSHRFLTLNIPGLTSDGMKVGKIACDTMGRIWVCCDGLGVHILDGTTGRLLKYIGFSDLNFFNSDRSLIFWNIALSSNNDVAIASNWGLRLFHNDTLIPVGRRPPGHNSPFAQETLSCAFSQDGEIWFSNAHGLCRMVGQGGDWIKVSENTNENDAWQSSIYSIYADDNHFIWVGSEEGLSYFSPTRYPFAKYYKSYNSGTKIQHAFSICPVNDSIVYCGAANGLYRVNIKNYSINKIDESGSCYLISPIATGQYIVSNSRGSFILQNDILHPLGQYYPELSPMQSDLLCCCSRFNDSILVLGSELRKGLYVWDRKAHKVRLFNNNNSDLHLDDGLVNALFKDHQERLWILSVSSLFRLDPIKGRVERFHFNAPGTTAPISILFDICQTRDRFWIAAYGAGVIEADNDMHFIQLHSEKDGLSNNGVYKIFAYADSLVLATSNNGLSILELPGKKIRRYTEADGLQSNSFEQFCGFDATNVKYAGGVNGFTVIHPQYLSHNLLKPLVYFTQVSTEGSSGRVDTSHLHIRSLTIPSDVYQTTVHFTGLNFTNPQKTSFSYRIKELNTNWVNLGNHREIDLVGINPGNYTLQVRAENEDGIWDSSNAVLALTFLPPWYQTLWFKAILLLLLIGIFYSLYRYRIGQLKKQQQIRTGIASDLHDDIGSLLNSMKVFSHLAKKEPTQEEHFRNIDDSLTQATTGLRDMIWVLDNSEDNLTELFDRIRKYAGPVTAASGIRLDCTCTLSGTGSSITKTEKRNLLLIVKEAINNSIKYSDCSSITLTCTEERNGFRLLIQDDGKGFDTTRPSFGNGLRNMAGRAGQIHYHYTLTSNPGSGTTIQIYKK